MPLSIPTCISVLLALAGCLVCLPAARAPGAEAAPAPAVVIELWPAGAVPGKHTDKPEEVMPAKGDDVERITNVGTPTLSLFRAVPAQRSAPALLVCPGGGYKKLAFDKEGTDVAAWLAANGFTAVVLKYRVPDNRDGAFQDVQRAIRVVRQHAVEWGIDQTRVGIMGFSAGGHLAARVSTDPTRAAYAAIDAADALPCRPDFAVLVYPAYLAAGDRLAKELPIGPQIPPTLIVHTDDDKGYVVGSRLYHAALDAAGIANEFACYASGGHGYGMRSAGAVRVWPERALAWLRGTGGR